MSQLLGQEVPPAPADVTMEPLRKPRPFAGLPPAIAETLGELAALFRQLIGDKEEAIAEQDFERAAHLRDRVDKLAGTIKAIIQEWTAR